MGQHHNTHGAAVTVSSLIASAIENNEGIRLNWKEGDEETGECPTVVLAATVIAQLEIDAA